MEFNLLKKVRNTIVHYNMLRYGDTVLTGVSSGPDSVCLLCLLNELREEYNLSLHIAHLNHGFRGSEADEDVRFVQAIGDSLNIPVHIEYIDVQSYIKKARISKQAGAREVRYKFFKRIADDISADRIALGHTADDQAETFLMRLLKGSGLQGLSGIPPVRDKIIRPLIETSREEIASYLSDRDIRYRIDSSNLSTAYLRNKVRLELIPYLEKEYNPNIMDTLIRNLKILRDEDIFLDKYIKGVYPNVAISKSGESIQFDIRKLRLLTTPIRRRVLRHAIEAISMETSVTLSFRHIEDSLALLESDKGGEIHLPCGIIAKKDKETFAVYLRSEVVPTPPYASDIIVPGNTTVAKAGITVSTTIIHKGELTGIWGKEGYVPYKAYFDMDKFSLPLTIRNRRTGDLFYPKGMDGRRKKIKEYFIDMKVHREDRDGIPILVSSEGILWIIGYRTDERFKVTSATNRILEVRAVTDAA